MVVLDDDVLYNAAKMHERIHKHISENPNDATGLFGRTIDTTPVHEGPTDVVEAVTTIMVHRSLLPRDRNDLMAFIDEWFPKDAEIFMTDDLIISAWFSLNDIKKLIYRMDIKEKFLADGDKDALFVTNFQYRNKRNFDKYRHCFERRSNVLFFIILVIFLCVIVAYV
jgi:hypothetical protein